MLPKEFALCNFSLYVTTEREQNNLLRWGVVADNLTEEN